MRADPEPVGSVDRLLEAALALRRRGLSREALRILSDHVVPHHSDFRCLLLFARILIDTGEFRQGYSVYVSLAKTFPRLKEPFLGMAYALDHMGMTREAVVVLKRHIRLNPDFTAGMRILARYLEKVGEKDAARDTLDRAAAIRPELETWMFLGRLHASAGRLPEAMDAFRRAHGLEPANPEVLRALYGLSRRCGLGRRAARWGYRYHEAVRPPVEEAESLVVLCLENGCNSEALAVLEDRLEQEPERPGLHLLHGRVMEAMGDLDQARASLQKLLDLAPGDLTALRGLARICLLTGDPSGERVYLNQVLLQLPHDIAALDQLAGRDLEEGRFCEAAERLDKLLLLDPDRPGIRLRRGAAHLHLGALQAARESVLDEIRRSPRDHRAYLIMGEICRRTGDEDLSQRCFQTAMSLAPASPEGRTASHHLAAMGGRFLPAKPVLRLRRRGRHS